MDTVNARLYLDNFSARVPNREHFARQVALDDDSVDAHGLLLVLKGSRDRSHRERVEALAGLNAVELALAPQVAR